MVAWSCCAAPAAGAGRGRRRKRAGCVDLEPSTTWPNRVKRRAAVGPADEIRWITRAPLPHLIIRSSTGRAPRCSNSARQPPKYVTQTDTCRHVDSSLTCRNNISRHLVNQGDISSFVLLIRGFGVRVPGGAPVPGL